MMIMIFILLVIAAFMWLFILSKDKYCPTCGCKMRKAFNDWYCDNCGTLYHMNMFGKLKERNKAQKGERYVK